MQPFRAERVVKSYTMNLCRPPKDVFPLLCPVWEYDWIELWSCDMNIERMSPEAHQDFLESLGIDALQINEIREWSTTKT